MYINENSNVGIGTTDPGNYKLNLQGNQFLKGSLTIEEGKVNLNGNQQIVFTDTDVTNNLKLQLWTGFGLGINDYTLFYTANGKHSWRDHQNNERMKLSTGADGGLTVTGTGASSFAGSLTVNGNLTINTGGDYGWNKLVVNTTTEWGDGTNQYVTIGAGGASGIMLSNPHVTWRDNRASIRYGRSGGIQTGSYWDAGVRQDGSFSFSLEGASDNKLTIAKNGNISIQGAIQPSAGKTENNGIMFPKDPGGGSGDAAWIRYYSRNPNSSDPGLKEQTTLEIGISNDNQDYISLNSFSNPINFTGMWQGTPDAVTNVAEISNDTYKFKTLMIVGNNSNGQGRRVSVWDRFEVNGVFVNNSSQEHKQDITELSSQDLTSILDELKNTPVFRYRFKTPGIDEKLRLGVIAEQSPEHILDESGKAVSFLDYNGFLLAALKAQQSLIENLQNDILLLHKG